MRRNRMAIVMAALAVVYAGCVGKINSLSTTPEDPIPGVVPEASTDIGKLVSYNFWAELPPGGMDKRHYRFRSYRNSVNMYNVNCSDGPDSMGFVVFGTFAIDEGLNRLSISGVRLIGCPQAGAGVAAVNDTPCTGYRAQLDGNGDTLRFSEECRYSWSGDTLLLESGPDTATILRKLMPYTILPL